MVTLSGFVVNVNMLSQMSFVHMFGGVRYGGKKLRNITNIVVVYCTEADEIAFCNLYAICFGLRSRNVVETNI